MQATKGVKRDEGQAFDGSVKVQTFCVQQAK